MPRQQKTRPPSLKLNKKTLHRYNKYIPEHLLHFYGAGINSFKQILIEIRKQWWVSSTPFPFYFLVHLQFNLKPNTSAHLNPTR